MVSDGYAFLVEMLFDASRAGCRIGEVPIIFVERRQGQSKLSSGVLLESLHHALAARVPRTAELTCVARRRDGHDVVPAVSGRQRRHVHGADRQRARRARPRDPHRRAVASVDHARTRVEDGVHFHFFKYAPVPALNVFGYAQGMHADVQAARARRGRPRRWRWPPAGFKAMRVAQKRRATIMHGHWVVPGGAIAALARPALPLVVSLHGSDVFVAERVAPATRRRAAACSVAPASVTACSDDLARARHRARRRARSHGGHSLRRRHGAVRTRCRSARAELPGPTWRAGDRSPLIFTAGRLVRKKGFEYLIDALPLRRWRGRAGPGDRRERAISPASSRARAPAAGVADRVRFLGDLPQDQVGRWFAAADVAVVPSVRDDSGNVDGLPNTVHGSAGVGHAARRHAGRRHRRGRRGRPDRPDRRRTRARRALAAAIASLLRDPSRRARAWRAGRDGWSRRVTAGTRVAARFEAAYDRALAFNSLGR